MFLAIVVKVLPPFFVSFLRYGLATLILLAIGTAMGHFKGLNKKEVKNALIGGVLMLGIGAGLTSWVLQFLDSGFTALLISGEPLIVVFMMWYADKKKPSNQVFLGVLLGIVGIYLLVSQNEIVAQKDQWMAIIVLVICLLAWGVGSIFISKADMPKSFIANTGIQMGAGTAGTLLFSLIFESVDISDFAQVDRSIIYAFLYLCIFGSVIAFMAFNYLLKNVTPDKVATSTYVNPIIAVFLGWCFLDEMVTIQSLVAALVMLTGVFLINFKLESIKKGLYSRLPRGKKR